MSDTDCQPTGNNLTENEQYTLMMLKMKQADPRLYDAWKGLGELALEFRSMQDYLIALAEFLRYEGKDTSGLSQNDPELYSASLIVLGRALASPHLCKALGALGAFSEEKARADEKRGRRSRRRRATRESVGTSAISEEA